MGAVEVRLGPAGCGKTARALEVLREEIARGWSGVRYLVPTVPQKRAIEQLLVTQGAPAGLLGDPVTTFFTFAEEIARGAGRRLSELQKHLALRNLVQDAGRADRLAFFRQAARYPGFVTALGDAIDELKVHMVPPEALLAAAETARERGASGFADKVGELGALYADYQTWLNAEQLYDSEGIMWIAAERLDADPTLGAGLRCLILDGFPRLTPIQARFLQALAARVPRIIVLFDYEAHRSDTYHPVAISLDRLAKAELRMAEVVFDRCTPPDTALAALRGEVFRGRGRTCPPDDSLRLLPGATPAHEAEVIAREIRALLRHRVPAGEIAVLARSAGGIRGRLERACADLDVPLRREPPALAHTAVGRALLAVFRLVRENWRREDVLTLLRIGFLDIAPEDACRIDLTARAQYLRERKSAWLLHWPEDETREALRQALAPIAGFADLYGEHRHDARALLEALSALLKAFRNHALPAQPPMPDVDPEGARRHVELTSAFAAADTMLAELQGLGTLLGGFSHSDLLDVVQAALLREYVPTAEEREGVALLDVHATGGEKFRYVFLCDLLEGRFPRHVRESAFLADRERDETLRDLQVTIDTRRGLEQDERYWLLHALGAARERLYLCWPVHDAEGGRTERSSFLDEIEAVIPAFRDAPLPRLGEVAPPPEQAESRGAFLAGLALRLREAGDPAAQAEAAAAYTACITGPDLGPALARLFRQEAAPLGTAACAHLAGRTRPYSATELQGYLDCPFLWFARSGLAVSPVRESYGALDRGAILHDVLHDLYKSRQGFPGEPVLLHTYDEETLWTSLAESLRVRLEMEPRFRHRPPHMKEVEREELSRQLRRFLRFELARSRARTLHPAYFEVDFGMRGRPVRVGNGIPLQGRIDRIDIADDGSRRAVVIDYKTGAPPSATELTSGRELQGPTYLWAVEQLLGLEPVAAEFVGVRKSAATAAARADAAEYLGAKKPLDPEQWAAWRAACLASAEAAVRGMAAGDTALAPSTKMCPDRCEFYALCRGERYALKRAVSRRAAVGSEP